MRASYNNRDLLHWLAGHFNDSFPVKGGWMEDLAHNALFSHDLAQRISAHNSLF
jgi:hypothetical protein